MLTKIQYTSTLYRHCCEQGKENKEINRYSISSWYQLRQHTSLFGLYVSVKLQASTLLTLPHMLGLWQKSMKPNLT